MPIIVLFYNFIDIQNCLTGDCMNYDSRGRDVNRDTCIQFFHCCYYARCSGPRTSTLAASPRVALSLPCPEQKFICRNRYFFPGNSFSRQTEASLILQSLERNCLQQLFAQHFLSFSSAFSFLHYRLHTSIQKKISHVILQSTKCYNSPLLS